MPLPKAVATSKPKRETWMIEELYDTLIGGGLYAEIVKTRYPGVVLVYANIEPARLSKIVYSNYHAFMKRFTPAMSLIHLETRSKLSYSTIIDEINKHIDNTIRLGAKKHGVNIIVALRGISKSYIDKQLIENKLLSSNIRANRRSNILLIIESVDEFIFMASGITRYCGPGCVTVSPG